MSGSAKITLGALLRQKRIDYGYEDLDAMARDLLMEPWHLHRLHQQKAKDEHGDKVSGLSEAGHRTEGAGGGVGGCGF